MYSAADLIAALRRRDRLHPRTPGAVGWSRWFDVAQGDGAARGDRVGPLVAVLVGRGAPGSGEPAPVPTRAGAFRALWRQRWDPPLRDERPSRAAAAGSSALLHLLFAVALVWLLATGVVTDPPDRARSGEAVTQVEFIGTQAPVEPADSVPAPQVAPVQPVPRLSPPERVTADQPSIEPPPVTPVPEATPVAETQPLQVTEVPAPDTTFVLPPARTLAVATPGLRTPDVALRERSVPTPPVAPPLRPLTEVGTAPLPSIDATAPAVMTRDIPLPAPRLRPRVPVTSPTAPLAPRDVTAVAREIPMPSAPAPPTADAPASRVSTATPGATTPAATPGPRADRAGLSPTTPAAAPGSARSAAAVGPSPGGQPASARGDDWGVGGRDRPGGAGGAPGLYNPDGSPRLANGGRVGGGLPPGTITEDYEKIDRMGTWLKRPPVGYEPTAFDRFWVPHENLLQEWVRRSIKEVLIPIPGTSKRIRCSVALLALGGACGLSDANLQDVEAGARPPPDVPFRPDLQEDQGSLRKPR